MVISAALAQDSFTTRRLIAAGLVSAALHVSLLLWLPLKPAAGVPGAIGSLIEARLQPAQGAVIEEAQAESEASAVQVATNPGDQAKAEATPEPKPAANEPQPIAEPGPSHTAGIEVPLIRDPTYYSAKQLDAYPEPLAPIRLQYPETAVADEVNGRLLLLLLIDEFGVVADVSAVEADPPGYFEEAAGSVFRAMRFKPGMRQGRAVKCRVLVQVRYTYGDAEGAVK